MQPPDTPGPRPVPPETARLAWTAAQLRSIHDLSPHQVGYVLHLPAERVTLYERAAAGVPADYLGGLAKMCAYPFALVVRHLMTDFPPDTGALTPLPADATAPEVTLRLVAHEPAAAEPAANLIASQLRAAPAPDKRALRRLGDPFAALAWL